MAFKEINIKSLEANPVRLFDDQWALLTAGDKTQANTMTISWGALGEFWSEDTVNIYVRQSRYTKEFIDKKDTFSCCFFDSSFRKKLAYLGAASGRDEDKITKAGLSLNYDENETPYFDESEIVIICEKIYFNDLNPENILDEKYRKAFYGDNDYHTMYIGKVIKVLVKE